jgi:hypothetical protein
MARNAHAGSCYVCGLTVKAGTGHFERHNGSWRVKHANHTGHGRITCAQAKSATQGTKEGT